MIRSRDFLLFLMTVLFLLGGITTSVLRDASVALTYVVDQGQLLSTARIVEEYHVAESEPEVRPSVVDRLHAMRTQIEEYRASVTLDRDRFVVREGQPESMDSIAVSVSTTDDDMAESEVQSCAGYQLFAREWPTPVVIEQYEGAQLVIHRQPDFSDVSVLEESVMQGEILLQLPTAYQPIGTPSCLMTDVVGIARDGSLIRNNEHEAYGFFSAETVVGYALDGFPIYGRNDATETDQCGGGMGVAGYGYILMSDRPAVLNCFSGRPVSI